MSDLATRLRTIRLQKGLTQTELAELCGVDMDNIKSIERGKNKNPTKILEIAKGLNVSPGWLRFGTSDIDNISPEGLELLISWEHLEEPHRTIMKNTILEMAKKKK
jgi:transcriptional regulator with XRE-family HTH domain